MAERDYYDVLGVKRDATAAQVKSAYRRLVRKHHPDVDGSPEATEKFKEATAAYEVLSDAEKRKVYDQFGHAGAAGPFAGADGRGRGPQGGGFSFNLGDLFGGGGSGFMGMGLDEILQALRGGGRGGQRRAQRKAPKAQRGADTESRLTLDFIEAVRGTVTRIRIVRHGPDGKPREETLDVKIPPGVQEGSKIRVRSKGRLGPGEPGDLYIVVQIRPHAFFRREGDDVYVKVPITIAEAALGAKVDVPTLDGISTVTIPAGTASSKRLRLQGKGVRRGGKAAGDQYVTIEIVPPKSLSVRQKQLLAEFAEADSFDPRQECPWT